MYSRGRITNDAHFLFNINYYIVNLNDMKSLHENPKKHLR